MTKEYEYILVGSGVAATMLTQSLLETTPSASILILEAGPRIELRDRRSWWDLLVKKDETPYKHTYDVEGGESTFTADKWGFYESRVRAYGGSTMHWGGWSLRYLPEDFRCFTEVGKGADWPFGYDELEPWYSAAEVALSVGGVAEEPGPPRRAPYPLPAFPWTAHEALLADAFEKHGLVPGHMPLARNARCMTTGTCKYCPIGARYTATDHLDELVATPAHSGLDIRTNMTVLNVLADRKHAYGVHVLDGNTKKEETLQGNRIVICAGAYESPKLLLRSISPDWPNGLGNNSDQVGRYLVTHTMLRVRGEAKSNSEGWFQEYDFPTLMSRSWDCAERARAGKGKVFLYNNRALPHTDIAALFIDGATRDKVNSEVFGAREAGLDAFIEEYGEPHNRITNGTGEGRFGLPKTVVEFRRGEGVNEAANNTLDEMQQILVRAGYERHSDPKLMRQIQTPRGDHSSGTCRMGAEVSTSVVDRNLCVHGVDNLYVCSNAVLPNAAAVNPTLTLAALSLRLGAHLADTRP